MPASPLVDAEYLSLPTGTNLHRVHSSNYGSVDFNPCKGLGSRFAPIQDNLGNCVPSLYAGATIKAAIHESIFHDIPANAGMKTVRIQDIFSNTYSVIETLRHLQLVELRNPNLSKWGISRRELIESYSTMYQHTSKWAQEIHHSFPDADGMVWTSRQCDPDDVYVFFGDRVNGSDFSQLSSLTCSDSRLIRAIRKEGKTRGVTIIIRNSCLYRSSKCEQSVI